MSKLEFVPIGGSPHRDAVRMHKLCTDDAVDQRIINEFESTITRYSSADIDELSERITEKYTVPYPDITGDLIIYNDEEIGVAYSGAKDVLKASSEEFIEGVNVSVWILSTHRGAGIGRKAIAYAVERALLRTYNSDEPEWYSRTIWTSIHDDNIASQKACRAAGFKYAYPQVELENRSIYLLH